jgi:hypothetical protein
MDRAELHTWLTTRLTSERARADFARVLEVAWAEFTARPVAEVLPRAGVDAVARRSAAHLPKPSLPPCCERVVTDG